MITICVEGVNGAGKTTQSKLLADRLEKRFGREVARFTDPGVAPGYPAYDEIRPLARHGKWKNPLTRMMLYMAARCEVIAETRMARVRDVPVVLDRYTASFYAYAAMDFFNALSAPDPVDGCSGHSMHVDAGVHAINDILIACNAFVPDITVIIFLPDELALARWKQVSGDKPDVFERLGIDGISHLASMYRDIWRRPDTYKFAGKKIIDVHVTEDASPESVSDCVWAAIYDYLPDPQE